MNDNRHNVETPAEEGRQPVFLLPGVVTALVGLMVAIHLASAFVFNDEARLQFTIWFAFLPYRLIEPELIPGGMLPLLWTPFTHAFMHAGVEHLLMNSAWLAIFGTPVARRYGATATVILFLVTSAVGALCFAATTINEVQFLIGASGGVAGFTGAAVRIMFQPVVVATDPETGERVVLGRHLATLKEVLTTPASRNFTIIWVVLNAAVPLMPLLTGASVQIAWQAHLGGFFAGLFLAPLCERRGH